MTDYPCAKINLGLNVVSKRADGYHNLETVFFPVNIKDVLCINEVNETNNQEHSCELSLTGINIDGNTQDNLVVKAYKLLKKHFPTLPNVKIELTKNIPTQAGMGGGSSDCAFTISLLNKMFKLNLSVQEMQKLASEIGSDCAFFINPVPSFATGKGEELEPIDLDLKEYKLAIVKPPISISTKEAYSHITPQKPAKCCREIVLQPIETWKDELTNDFEKSIIQTHKEIGEIKQKLYEMGAIYAAMSGSGSAVFGFFRSEPNEIADTFKNCFTVIV